MAVMNKLAVKDATAVRADFLRTVKNGMYALGVAAPVVDPTTDWYIQGTAIGNEIAAIGYNAVLRNDAQMPDSAVDEDMVRIAAFLKRSPQPAGPSIGPVIMKCSAPAPVPTGAVLTDTLGQTFEVVVGGIIPDGYPVTIRAISTGKATNHAEGDVLQWQDTIAYADTNVFVGPGGLVNGIDAEDTEVLRARVLSIFRVPPGNGNWEQVVEDAEASSPTVSKAFAHPAVQGPSTFDISVVAAPTADSKSRVVDPTTITSYVSPYVLGINPRHAFGTITSVEDVLTDVAFSVVLPSAPTASPPGTGGGWLDGTPWPRPDGVATFKCTVTAVTNTTHITVDEVTSPTVGTTRISWLSTVDWTVYTAQVVAVAGSTGAWQLTLDQPIPGIVSGGYIWPACDNAQAYCDAILAAYAAMGPGEKTASVSALVRGFRHPPPNQSWPASLGAHLTRAIEDANDAASAPGFLYRKDNQSGVSINGPFGPMVPTVPAAYAAPRIFIPRHIGIYAQP